MREVHSADEEDGADPERNERIKLPVIGRHDLPPKLLGQSDTEAVRQRDAPTGFETSDP